jgi:elongation factor Ts
MMAEITASLVKELRDKTGAGMMDCKAALNETKGDVEAAVDWLRKKGLAKAAKKSGRTAAEGLVGVAMAGGKGVLVEVNSETDFVARNEQFQEMVRHIGAIALKVGDDVEAIKSAAYPGGGTVAEKIANLVATIGENMTLRRAGSVTVASGTVAQYMHSQVADGLGKIGVIVGLKASVKGDAAVLGRQIAMHVAAANPVALDAASVDPAVIEREKAVLAEKARASGKPEAVVDKIVESGLKTFFKEVCLVDQPFIHDPSKTVAQAVGGAEHIAGFVRFALGEGIEKETTDFAAEVAAAVKSG